MLRAIFEDDILFFKKFDILGIIYGWVWLSVSILSYA